MISSKSMWCLKQPRVLGGLGLLISGALGSSLGAQGDWGPSHAPVRLVLEAADDFADLERLGDMIGDRSIVVFRGDEGVDLAGPLSAKGRLIAFLHEEHGFDRMVFPVGVYEAHHMDLRVAQGAEVDVAFEALYPIMRRARPLRPLLEHIIAASTTESPFRVLGKNCQYHRFAKVAYPQHLIDVFDECDDAWLEADTRTALKETWANPTRFRDQGEGVRESVRELAASLIENLEEAEEDVADVFSAFRAKMELHCLRNMIHFCDLEELRATSSLQEIADFRSRIEAQNVAWLLEQDPEAKWIFFTDETPVPESRQDDVFEIGMTVYEGTRGRLNQPSTTVMSPVSKESVEAELHGLGTDAILIDVAKIPSAKRRELSSKPLERLALGEAERWVEALDALIFIDRSGPCVRVDE